MEKMKVSNVKVYKRRDKKNSEKDYFLGSASFLLNGSFLVHGVRLYERDNNRYVLMPNRKVKNEWVDICHPTTKELREDIENEIFKIYDEITD